MNNDKSSPLMPQQRGGQTDFRKIVCSALETLERVRDYGLAVDIDAAIESLRLDQVAPKNLFFDIKPAAVLPQVEEAKPFTYFKEPHKGWPEYSKTNEFSDGNGGGLALYTADHASLGEVKAIAADALDVEVILDLLAKQHFSFEQSKFQGGGTTVKGGIGDLIEFAHAVRKFAAAPKEQAPAAEPKITARATNTGEDWHRGFNGESCIAREGSPYHEEWLSGRYAGRGIRKQVAEPDKGKDAEFQNLLSAEALLMAAKAVEDSAVIWTGFSKLDAKTCITAAINVALQGAATKEGARP